MTQQERLLKHFKLGRTINRLTALTELGIFELSARIKGLESDGYRIERERITVTNRFGEQCSCMKYWIELANEPDLFNTQVSAAS